MKNRNTFHKNLRRRNKRDIKSKNEEFSLMHLTEREGNSEKFVSEKI